MRSAPGVAHRFKINESDVKTLVKKEKEICEAVTAAMPGGPKTLHFWRNIFLSLIENAAYVGAGLL